MSDLIFYYVFEHLGIEGFADLASGADRTIIFAESKIRIIVGVALLEDGLPLLGEGAHLAMEASDFGRRILGAARFALVVEEFGIRREDDLIVMRANLQTEIDIIKGDFKFLVESANLVIDLAGSHKTSSSNGRVALNGVVLIMVTTILSLDISNGVEKVTGNAAKPDYNARMLNGFIPEEQFSADGTNVFSL